VPNDASVEKELEDMMRQEPAVPALPQIPTKMPVQSVGMEAELRELERVPMSA
jgi:hypothetical protein